MLVTYEVHWRLRYDKVEQANATGDVVQHSPELLLPL